MALSELGRQALLRRTELFGQEFTIWIDEHPLDSSWVSGPTGLEPWDFPRAIALQRLQMPPTQHLLVDITSVGLDLAEIAIIFGADSWRAPLAPLVTAGLSPAQLKELLFIQPLNERMILRERELANVVSCAGFVPRVASHTPDGQPVFRPPNNDPTIRRRFRAPGRDFVALRK